MYQFDNHNLSVGKWGLAMICATLIGILLLWGTGQAAQDDQLAIVVADFGDEGCDPGTGAAVAENLRTFLAGTGNYSLVDRNHINDIVREGKLGMSELTSSEGAALLGRLAVADLVIVGSVVKMGNRYAISARIVLPDTSLVLASAGAEAVNAAALSASVRKLATDLEDAAAVLKTSDNEGQGLLFADDFYLRANARWQPIIPGSYYVEDRLMHVGDANKGGQYCRALIGVRMSEESYIFSGKMRMLSDPDDGGGVVIGVRVGSEMQSPSYLRFPSPDKGVAEGGGGGTFVVMTASGRVGLVSVDGKRHNLPRVKSSGRINPNVEHTYRLEVAADGVDLYLDEVIVGSLRGVPRTGDEIAVGTFGRAEAAFANIRVTKY